MIRLPVCDPGFESQANSTLISINIIEVEIGTVFVIGMRKGRKQTKKAGNWPNKKRKM